jgi:GAF domain-containing protein
VSALSPASLEILERQLGLAPGDPEPGILRLLIELAAQVVGAHEGSLLVLDGSEDPPRHLLFAMTVGSHESEQALAGQRVPLGSGLVGLAAVTHEVQIGEPAYDAIVQRAGSPTPRAVIAAPMLADDQLVGVISAVSFDEGRRFSADDARLYARAAAVAGLLVQQRRALSLLRGGAPGGPEEQALRASVDRLIREHPDRLGELAGLFAQLERVLRRTEG